MQVENLQAYQGNVTRQAARAYQLNVDRIALVINHTLSNDPDLASLIGDAPLNVMYDNHRNHASVIANVLQLNNYELLASILPWVYNAYVSRGFSFDYFPKVLAAGKKAIGELLPEEYNLELQAVYDWILSCHADLKEGVGHSVFMFPPPSGRWIEIQEAFTRHALAGDVQAANDLAVKEAVSTDKLISFFIQVVQGALYQIGALWETNQISVAEEHLASITISRVLAGLSFANPTQTKGQVLISAAPNEFHQIGAWLVADALAADGWRTSFLGADTPAAELKKMAEKLQPDIICISVTMPFNLDKAALAIADLRSAPQLNKTRIMIGGLPLNLLPSLSNALAADAWAGDCREAVELARKWWQEMKG